MNVFILIKKYRLPIVSVICAIGITTWMDFNGYFDFSALPLFILISIFWLILRLSKSQIGLKWGKLKYYGIALLYPAIVLSLLALTAFTFGDFATAETDWYKITQRLLIGSTIGIVMVIITEEGFFRGWLWGAFRRNGMSPQKTLFFTSVFFTIWHISAITSPTDYGLPLVQVPIYLVNATLLGLIWGSLRLLSGSIIVASVCHAVWNAFAYELFAFGENVGALGIKQTIIFGPEVGILGIVLNGAFFLWMWGMIRKQKLS